MGKTPGSSVNVGDHHPLCHQKCSSEFFQGPLVMTVIFLHLITLWTDEGHHLHGRTPDFQGVLRIDIRNCNISLGIPEYNDKRSYRLGILQMTLQAEADSRRKDSRTLDFMTPHKERKGKLHLPLKKKNQSACRL